MKTYNLHTSNLNLTRIIRSFVLSRMPYVFLAGSYKGRVKPGDDWDDPAGPPSMTGRAPSQKGQHHSVQSLHRLDQTE